MCIKSLNKLRGDTQIWSNENDILSPPPHSALIQLSKGKHFNSFPIPQVRRWDKNSTCPDPSSISSQKHKPSE